MKRKIEIIIFVIMASLQVGCNSKKENTKEDKPAETNCKDVFLDPMYSHFYLIDREHPFTGVCIERAQSGKMIAKKNFIDGKLEGEYFEYYESGAVKSEWHFLKNRQHGILKGYDEQGNLLYETSYYKGDLDTLGKYVKD